MALHLPSVGGMRGDGGLAPTVHPLLHQDVTAEPLLFREEEWRELPESD
jgi:hypothetical protein